MSFSSDIKDSMRDCLLKIFWAKDDFISFFKGNGCTASDIKSLGNHKELSRAKIVDSLFTHLSSRSDEGLGQFRAMLQSIINWNNFDTFYFDKLAKLNKPDAQRAIEHLKQLQELRDRKIKETRRQREKKAEQSKVPKNSLRCFSR